ncbi:MAG: PilZ domain-containing protein [Acidobacteriota bacterium]|nr:PilZ domain-containing protein [Acidobacteriota bacterium]
MLAPPLAATFGGAPVAICDISSKGVRFRHDKPLEQGGKGVLQLAVETRPSQITLETVIVWSQPDPSQAGKFMSGGRTYGPADVMQSLLAHLQTSKRTSRIEELRSTDRFRLEPSLQGTFDTAPALIEDLSARGARIELRHELPRGARGVLRFVVPEVALEVSVSGAVAWSAVKAIGVIPTYRLGLLINEKPELMRLAIAHLCEMNRAALDTQSLRLKLKIIRARARQLAPSFAEIEASGIPAEQFLLVQGVREELRLNPEEAMHWYRRARLVINDPATHATAPLIANHPDALAVWEYLDRSVDPSIVGRAFELPSR